MIFVISGPSGVGKSTIIKNLDRKDDLYFSISHTTRPIRSGESEGIDYYYIDKEIFNEMIDQQKFVEYEEYGGFLYGTSKSELTKLSTYSGLVLDLEVKGATNILSEYANSVGIFIDINNSELEKRLISRGHKDETFIKTRISLADKQRDRKEQFEYYILNEEIITTVNEINDIIYNRIL